MNRIIVLWMMICLCMSVCAEEYMYVWQQDEIVFQKGVNVIDSISVQEGRFVVLNRHDSILFSEELSAIDSVTFKYDRPQADVPQHLPHGKQGEDHLDNRRVLLARFCLRNPVRNPQRLALVYVPSRFPDYDTVRRYR